MNDEQRRKRRAQYDKQRLAAQAEFDASYVAPRSFADEAAAAYAQYVAMEDGPQEQDPELYQQRPDWIDQQRPEGLDQKRPKGLDEFNNLHSDEEC